MPDAPASPSPVRQRRVLYLSGFDPQGPARYHRLYRDEAAAQARVSGHQIVVGPRQHDGPLRDHWSVEATIEGQTCRSRIDVLRWDDLIRSAWGGGHAAYLGLTARTTARTLANGVLWRLMRTSLPAFSVSIGAAVVSLVLGLAALALLTGTLAVWHAAGPLWGALAGAMAAAGGALLLRASRHVESAWYLGWVMRGFAHTVRQAAGQTPDLDARLDAHAEHLAACLADPSNDEVLVVGHSLGAAQAAKVVARLLQRQPGAADDPRLSLLTLGQWLPMLSYPPQARACRAEWVAVAEALGERWLDVSAPADRCCTALVDPVDAARGLGEPAGRSPKLISPQFQKLFTPEGYTALCADLFEMHFQYLKAGECPGLYDYFAITAGPLRLQPRFADQPGVRQYRALQCLGGPFPDARR